MQSAQCRSALSRGARQSMFVPVSDPPAATTTGLAHVATVSFLAARAAPSTQFWIALAGGIALARAAALRGVRAGYGASAAAMLQTVAVMGPARVNGPLTQALTAPLLGALHRARHGPAAADRRLLRDPADALRRPDRGRDLDRARRGRRLRRQLRHAHRLARDPAGGRARRADRDRGAQRRPRGLLHRHAGARVPLGAELVAGAADARSTRPRPGRRRTAARKRFDPRAITLAAAIAFALLLSGTWWALLASVAAWLALAWAVSRCDPEALSLGLALTALLVRRARRRRRLIAGLGLDEALQRGTRAGLLVLVATWLRAAAGPAGLRETFRRALWRIRAVPPAREASAILDGLDSGGRLIASGRTLVDELGTVEMAPQAGGRRGARLGGGGGGGLPRGGRGGAGAADGRAARRPARRARRRARRWRCSRTADALRRAALGAVAVLAVGGCGGDKQPAPPPGRCARPRPRTCARSAASATATATRGRRARRATPRRSTTSPTACAPPATSVQLQDVPFPVFRDRTPPRAAGRRPAHPGADAALLRAGARDARRSRSSASPARPAELRRARGPDRGRRPRALPVPGQGAATREAAGARGLVVADPRSALPASGSLIRPGLGIPAVSAGAGALRAHAAARGWRSTPWRRPAHPQRDRRAARAARRRVAMVGAHLDSVREGPGINDDGSGVAVTLALAERLRTRRLPLRVLGRGGARALRLARATSPRSAPAERRRIKGYVNLDMLGSPNAVRYVYGDGRVRDALEQALRARKLRFEPISIGADLRPRAVRGRRASPPPGCTRARTSARPRARRRAYGGRAGRPLDPCYHQRCDVLDRVDRDVMTELGEAAGQALRELARLCSPAGTPARRRLVALAVAAALALVVGDRGRRRRRRPAPRAPAPRASADPDAAAARRRRASSRCAARSASSSSCASTAPGLPAYVAGAR